MANIPSEVALDMSGVKPFEPLDSKVTYTLQVSKIENVEIQGKRGQFQAAVEFTVVAPEEVKAVDCTFDDKGKCIAETPKLDKNGNEITTRAKGRKMFRRYSFVEDARPFLHEFIRAADPTQVLDENFVFKPSDYMGLLVGAKIENSSYEEQIRANPRRILPAPQLEAPVASKSSRKK